MPRQKNLKKRKKKKKLTALILKVFMIYKNLIEYNPEYWSTNCLRCAAVVQSRVNYSRPASSTVHMFQEPQRMLKPYICYVFPTHTYQWSNLIYKSGTVRDYPNCQHHHSWALGPLLSKIRVAWTPALQYFSSWSDNQEGSKVTNGQVALTVWIHWINGGCVSWVGPQMLSSRYSQRPAI